MIDNRPAVVLEHRVRRVRLSVSIPEDLADWTRWRASKDSTTVSDVVAQGLRVLYGKYESEQETEKPVA